MTHLCHPTLTRRNGLAALSLGLLSGCSTLRPTPPVTLLPSDAGFAWPSVLQEAVDDQGRINFRLLAANRGALELAVASIGQTAPNNAPELFPALRDRLAFHINAYNALVLYAVVRNGTAGRASLLDRVDLFDLTDVVVGGQAVSLRDYRNGTIRPLGDARVNFALNDMAVSSPRLPHDPFTPAGLDVQLGTAARRFLAEPRNVQPDPARRVVRLSAVLSTYSEDFLRRAPSLLAYVNQYRADPVPDGYQVEFMPFDWTLNAQPYS